MDSSARAYAEAVLGLTPERTRLTFRPMRVSAVLTQMPEVWVAQCEEVDRTGEGRTPDEAVACLRQALEDYFDVQAVAPPAETVVAPIEIVIVAAPSNAASLMR
jgi:hypothetical protein